MNWHITYGSVCSGIEAASVAWHMLGFRASWFAEIEPFPSAVLAHRWPAVPNLGDMTKLAREVLLGIIAAPLILVGGTPCQDFSVAGMRAGLAGERGALTMKFVELADAIDHVRPDGDECVAVWENVPGVLSDKGNAFGNFLAALVGESEELQPPGGKWKDAGCVYGPKRAAAWRILDAQYFGLAQRRRRVFVIASARADFDPAAVLFESDSMRRDHPPRRGQGTKVAGTLTSSLGKNSGIPAGNDCNPRNLIAGTLQAGGKAAGSATLQDAESGLLVAFGGSANCKQTDVSTALSAHPGGTRMDAETETFVVHGTQDPDVALGIAHTLGRNHGQENAVFDPNQNTSVTNRSQPTPGLCHTLPASSQPPIAFSCKDYGADAGEVAPTLRAMGHGDSHANAGGQVAVQNTTGVRRLTPRECERLQGFPDDYTLIPWRGKPATECPDGPRYKAIGNSKAVPVVRWIGRRIQQQLERTA
ncbi:DNA cytosine methyltransferase [Pseudomonas aeruginosa]|uniref:DNA cytosine methyltransferase n=1 Tax=Pseudomonas aeruginosa TaxID=287 RepID=UPI00071B372C|nr:DNA cytosine methyltransferase [Pseudomonas aeruginosa]KSG25831.1 DNA (cytosine-5-)-methyltransferase [Pseudomonas aeruginosa]MCD2853462.1 DNA cytosine methyltransferase [Pseudomonas aeruginosa]MCS9469121.1 DNA cytosine methyltransferase [Pseudomonas aeruginosa]MCS9479869.1 DNA cytosine methyltransferase [Pseudomonas aeruginosa]NPZ97744.1 DNA cytosine methyltransferase [Pseudomonas aeruginosa]